jgi:hypothetical protein
MNTTICDVSKVAATMVRGEGLSVASRAEMTKPRLRIATAHLFPLFLPGPFPLLKDALNEVAFS